MAVLKLKEIREFLQNVDALIKDGDLIGAQNRFQRIERKDIPDRSRLEMAQVARRSQLFELQNAILRPLIANSKNHRSANTQELVEYALGLMRMGAVNEARMRLSTVDMSDCYEAQNAELHLALCQYDHVRAIEVAQNILQQFDLDSYERSVVGLNQIVAQIGSRQYDEAKEQLIRVNSVVTKNQWLLLLNHTYQLFAQVCIRLGHYQEAEDYLDLAYSLQGRSHKSRNSIFLKRWAATLQSHRERKIDKLLELKQVPEVQGHSATLRGIDYEILNIEFREPLYHHLFFGTPEPAYRKNLLGHFGDVPDSYRWCLGAVEPELDTRKGHWKGQDCFSSESQVGRLFLAVCSDFYGPLDLGRIHETLYPDESYHGQSSESRVRQAVSRFNQFNSAHGIPLSIYKQGAFFHRGLSGKFSVIVGKSGCGGRGEMAFQKLQSRFQRTSFSAKEARNCLGVSLSTVQRLLSRFCQEKRIEQSGMGVKTRYIISR